MSTHEPLTTALLVGMGVVAWCLTGSVRRYALRRGLLDVPNARSSHGAATPRGGGLAIAAAMLAGVAVMAAADTIDTRFAAALLGGGALVTAIGFVDDCRGLPPSWRLLGHFVAAAWVLAWLDSAPMVSLVGRHVHTLSIAYAALAVYLVWVLNLTNFMDGIDGLAAVETITVCLTAALVAVVVAPGRNDGWIGPVMLAAATAGFLIWNLPPADIFMGDSGSGFLGLMLASLSIHAAAIALPLFWCWVILLGVFVVDSTITLGRRVLRGERFYEAHRSHAYQHAAPMLGGHRPVTTIVGVINVAWLLPIALLVGTGAIVPPLGVAIAYTPLILAAFLLGAGVSPARPRVAERSEIQALPRRDVRARMV